MRLTPGKQQLIGNPVTSRRRGCLSRSRIALLDNPPLLPLRPAATASSVNNLETSDLATVSSDIHTDSQLQTGKIRKTAVLGRVRGFYATMADTCMILGLSLWRLRVLLTGKEDTTAPCLLRDSIRHSVFFKGTKLTDVQNPALTSRSTA